MPALACDESPGLQRHDRPGLLWAAAGLDLDGEDAIEALRPAQGPMPVGDRRLGPIGGAGGAGFRNDSSAIGARRREDAVIAGQVRAGLRDQGGQSRDKVLGQYSPNPRRSPPNDCGRFDEVVR